MAEQLGRYEIIGELGAGGMGRVLRARDPRVDREVAIKVLPAELAGDPERRARFEKEARAAGALNHPNLLTLYDVGDEGDAPYLVTELLEGETLRERLQAGPLAVDEALAITEQIAAGLGAAHQRGVVHRDIKPSNLFLCADGAVKILDFGIARRPAAADGEATESGVAIGTTGYMAPEQIRGRDIDGRTDLFALGVVLHEMVTGERPFAGDSSVDVAVATLHDEHGSTGVAQADAICDGCLAKEPGDRFASAAAVIEAIRSGARRRRRPPRWSLIVAATAATAAAAVAVAVAISRDGETAKKGAPASPAPTETRLTNLSDDRYPISFRISEDGAVLAYANRDGLFIKRPAAGGEHAVPKPDGVHLMLPLGFVPDRRQLVVAVVRDQTPSVARLDLVDDSLAPIREGSVGTQLSPDGKRLVVIDDDQRDRLKLLTLATGETRELLRLSSPDDHTYAQSWSPDSTRLALIWGKVEGPDRRSGLWVIDAGGGEARQVPVEGELAQPGGILGVAWSSANRIVYGRAAANRTGSELWEVGADGSAPRKLYGWPDATADWLAVVGGRLFYMKNRVQQDVYVGRFDGDGLVAPPSRLTTNESSDVFQGWTADGRVLFSSDRGGTYDLYGQRPGEGAAERLAGGPGDEFGAAIAGGLVFWREAPEGGCQLVVRRDGDDERELLSRERCDAAGLGAVVEANVACAAGRDDRCLLAEPSGDELVLSALNPKTGELRELYRQPRLAVGMMPVDLSADGRRAVVALREPPTIVTLDLETGAARARPVKSRGGLAAVALRRGAPGWITLPHFFTAELAWLHPDGSTTRLWDRGIEVVRMPRVSPDGERLGLTYEQIRTNVWVVDGLPLGE